MSNPDNYRAINLTAQISKAVERYLCPWFGPLLEDRAFGQAQFAYRKRHGARDAVLYYVLSWIAEMNVGNKVGIYCSDVSGAFDRVDSVLLLRKLESFGLNAKLVSVIRRIRHCQRRKVSPDAACRHGVSGYRMGTYPMERVLWRLCMCNLLLRL